MARNIEAFRLRTEIAVDAAKGRRDLQATERDVGKVGDRFKTLGKEINTAMKGADVSAGRKFGQNFGGAAVSSITGSIKSLGTTLGSVIGTAIAPGIGTAIGSTVGSAVDLALEKVSGPIIETITKGIELNKLLEETLIEYTTFTGSKAEGLRYLNELKKLSTDNGLRMGVLVDASERIYDFTGDLKLANTIMKASIEQAADFGGSEATFLKVADALGLIAEKGELSSRELLKLYRLGIDAPKRLAEATGLSVATLKRMMAQGRIDGAVASRLIAESIIREKAGFAQKLALTTTAGAERRFEALKEIRAAEGTAEATRGLGDFYRQANVVLDSPQAQQFVRFIDEKTGSLINMVQTASRAGINVAMGIGSGITSGESLKSLGSSFSSLGSFTEKTLKGVFEIQSPSERTKREIGIPIGLGIADGITAGFVPRFQGQTTDEIVAALEGLLKDPRVKAFFETIRRAEGGDTNIIVGGKRFSDLSRHPKIVGLRTSKGASTAAGSFQITGTNWYGKKGRPGLQQQLGLPDFSQHSQELAALKLFADREGGAGVRALLSGNIDRARDIAALDWTSTPGSKIGGGGQWSKQRWMGAYNQALGAGAGSWSDTNPLPVRVTAGVTGVSSSTSSGLNMVPRNIERALPTLNEYTLALGDADGAVVDMKVETQGLIKDALEPGTLAFNQLMNATSAAFHAAVPLVSAEKEHAAASIELTKEYQEAARKSLIVGIDMVDQLSRAIGSVSGLIPSQQVGKKRGLFSKILGIAAPFLSFIPGVGPILSTIAGAAASAIGGDYGGAATGVAGGFASGGVFRSSGGGSTGGATRPRVVGRAAGGPVTRGRPYLVGDRADRRPELFVPDDSGFIYPPGSRTPGGSGGEGVYAANMERLASVIERFESRLRTMRPHDVVAMGARGMVTAMSGDADLIRAVGRKQRLA